MAVYIIATFVYTIGIIEAPATYLSSKSSYHSNSIRIQLQLIKFLWKPDSIGAATDTTMASSSIQLFICIIFWYGKCNTVYKQY